MRQEEVKLTTDEVAKGQAAQTLVVSEEAVSGEDLAPANNATPEPTKRKSFIVDKQANSFDGLQPERRPRKKAIRTTNSGPVPSWRRWLPISIAAVSMLAVTFSWTQAHFSGEEYLYMGSLDHAIESYTRDAAADTQARVPSGEYHIPLAQIYLKKNQLSESIKAADAGLTIAIDKQTKQSLHLVKGMILAKQSQWDKALAEFTQAKPTKDEAKNEYKQKTRLREATIGQLIANVHLQNSSAANQALAELRPETVTSDNIHTFGQYMFLAGQNNEARAFLQKELSDNGRTLGTWWTSRIEEVLGDIDLSEKKYAEALKHYTLVDKDSVATCTLLDKRSRAYKATGNMVAYNADLLQLQKLHAIAPKVELGMHSNRYGNDLSGKIFNDNEEDMIKTELGTRYPELHHFPDYDD